MSDLERVVRTVLEEQRRIDVLVNNAGIGLHGAVEDVPIDRAHNQFEDDTPRKLRETSGREAYQQIAVAMAARAETALNQASKASDPSVIARAIRKAIESDAPRARDDGSLPPGSDVEILCRHVTGGRAVVSSRVSKKGF
ncbi:hypothetical protein [Actinopolymorpha alba]|uniref:hypothetical protein n=1 Tax=Actinopolymorpha alba TaxID=533267 RepID=UPI00037FFB92|nr:hypothetical protein [Actinopolymorpha alba]